MNCREIRKDIINYCEESGESSSTDEEELCKPRANLRRRDTTVSYNEEHLAHPERKEEAEQSPRYNSTPSFFALWLFVYSFYP